MYILPEDVLSKLICSGCFQYLSVKPVKIYSNGGVKCGRCSQEKDDGIVSLYGTIIGNGLFPCINRYEGCTQLQAYSQATFHEEECKSAHYTCPICQSKFTSFRFVGHYQKDHPEAVLENPVLHLTNEKEYEKYYMYKENDFVYILHVRCNLVDSCFYVNAACLGPPERVNKIKQYLKCYLGVAINSDQLFLETEERYCSLVENNAESFRLPLNADNSITIRFFLDKSSVTFINCRRSNEINTLINNRSGSSNSNTTTTSNSNTTTNTFVGLDIPKLYSGGILKRKLGEYLSPSDNSRNLSFPSRPENTCSFCQNYFAISNSSLIYKCESCYTNNNYCYTCYCIQPYCYNHDHISCLKLNTSLIETYSKQYFYCKWNCGSIFTSSTLGLHLDHCEKNIYAKIPLKIQIANIFNCFSNNENTHLISRSNVFSFKQYGFKNGEKVFVITRNSFKFVLHSSYENDVFNFWVSHDYPENYCNNIEFKIREKLYQQNLQYINTLTLDNRKNHIINHIWGFAVVLNIKVPK